MGDTGGDRFDACVEASARALGHADRAAPFGFGQNIIDRRMLSCDGRGVLDLADPRSRAPPRPSRALAERDVDPIFSSAAIIEAQAALMVGVKVAP